MQSKNGDKVQGMLTQQMDTQSSEFSDFQVFIRSKVDAQEEADKVANGIWGLKFGMEDYLTTDKVAEVRVGQFLRDLLHVAKIRQNRFARYIGMKPSNLSKLLKGERRLSLEQAMVLGSIFDMDPMIWIGIQTKNELHRMPLTKKRAFAKYKLAHLLAPPK